MARNLGLVLALVIGQLARAAEPGNEIVHSIPSTPEHPRNSEGSFVTLKSGRILFYYSEFSGGASDFSSAQIVEIHSDDRGSHWSRPAVFAETGQNRNLMSVSLLRLASGKIALFVVVKKTGMDCRPYLWISRDEAATWSKPVPVLQAPGYFVLNNDRVIQTRSGRLIVPLAIRLVDEARMTAEDKAGADTLHWSVLWYYSDDEGATWRQSDTWWPMPVKSPSGLQEPGAVELADGSLLGWARTDQVAQYGFSSRDNGTTWSRPTPTELKSPCSPASIMRLPHSSALLAIYNDHSGRFPFPNDPNPYGGRSPLVAAISTDGGRTWPERRVIEADLSGSYCYTAMHWVGDDLLLAYSIRYPHQAHLGTLRIRRISPSWLPSPTRDHP